MMTAEDLRKACEERPDAMVVLCYEDDEHLPDYPLCFSLQGMRIEGSGVLLVSMPVESAGTMRARQVVEHLDSPALTFGEPGQVAGPVRWENQHPVSKAPIASRLARVVERDTRLEGGGKALRLIARREPS